MVIHVNNMEYDVDELVSNLDFTSGKFNNINGIMLTNKEIEILDRYDINYKSCGNLKEIIFEIEEVIPDLDDPEELEYLSSMLAERDYYQNSAK